MTVIPREFDDGNPLKFWLLPMAREEFELWWMNQETFDDNPPGWNECAEELAKIFNETCEPKPIRVF